MTALRSSPDGTGDGAAAAAGGRVTPLRRSETEARLATGGASPASRISVPDAPMPTAFLARPALQAGAGAVEHGERAPVEIGVERGEEELLPGAPLMQRRDAQPLMAVGVEAQRHLGAAAAPRRRRAAALRADRRLLRRRARRLGVRGRRRGA